MKLTRKLIPAIIMLLVSAVLMSTASFAWFSMNEVVEATGMEVTASSEFIFLEIKGSEDGTTYSKKGTNALDATLFPVAHNTFGEYTGAASLGADSGKWYYQFSDNPASSTAAAGSSQTVVAPEKFGQFVASTTYEVRLHEGMLETAYDLHVSKITITAGKGIRVIVAGANGYQEFTATQDTVAYDASKVLSNTVTTTTQTITVYIYFDGTDGAVFTDNIYVDDALNLTGDVVFEMTAYTADHT